MPRKIPTILIFLLILCAVPARDALAAAPGYLRIFYYKENSSARASLFENWKHIDVLAPQAYAINGNGILEGGVDSLVRNFSGVHGIKLMPLVTNKAFGQAPLAAVLDDPAKQSAAIGMMVSEGQAMGYWGWQIDFEGMDLSYRDKFSAFVKNASEILRRNGLVLSVAAVAEISENPDDYPRNLWQKLIGVYDYESLGQSADFVSIMSYDDPNSSGPISGYPWLSKVLAYSRSVIPPEKISLGVPLYYWRWNTSTGKLVAIGGWSQMKNFIRRYGLYPHYSETEKESYLYYSSGGSKYVIWYENGRSMKDKIALIKKYGLHGFSAWVLGLEVPGFYTAL